MDSFLIRAVEVVLAYGVLIGLFWAFYDSWKFTPEQYKEARRMSRTPWLFVIGGAIVLNFSVAYFRFSDPFSSRSLTWMATVLVLVTYVYDMRPKLVQQRMAGL